MRISAQIHNQTGKHEVLLTTSDQSQSLTIAPKSNGFGSSVNGGELLFLALATCYCNDIYREAEKQQIRVHSVEVTVEGDFHMAGEPAQNVVYRARVTAEASDEAIRKLMLQTDQVSEIQNTLRHATSVTLVEVETVSILKNMGGKSFSKSVLAAIRDSKILGIRSGSEHRFIGVWVVVVKNRVFVRSWTNKQTGWFRAFLEEPKGAIQIPGREIKVLAKRVRGERLMKQIEDAYAAKYNTPASLKYVRGFRRPRRRETTTEFLPL
jgi:uncharacterized OsmC-like protein